MKMLIFCITLLVPSLVLAQSVERKVIASGGTATVSATGVQVSQTVGEAMVRSYSPGSLIVTEGFQQGNSTLIGVSQGWDATTFTVFPNPVGDLLHLRITSTQSLALQLSFCDMLGQQIAIPTQRVTVDGSLDESYDFSVVTTGTYLLLIRDLQSGSVKSLQIRKVD